MFFLVSGAAAAGKTTVARGIPRLLDRIECHDADERIVWDAHTRCRYLEGWVKLALKRQQDGVDFLLTAQSPLGELLACPSTTQLFGISACLLDCADVVRIQRMRQRGIDPNWQPNQDTVSWAAWHRLHAWDPQWEARVIVGNGPPTHAYGRWRDWQQGDPRWQVQVIDTTQATVEEVLESVAAWVTAERQRQPRLSPETRWWE